MVYSQRVPQPLQSCCALSPKCWHWRWSRRSESPVCMNTTTSSLRISTKADAVAISVLSPHRNAARPLLSWLLKVPEHAMPTPAHLSMIPRVMFMSVLEDECPPSLDAEAKNEEIRN